MRRLGFFLVAAMAIGCTAADDAAEAFDHSMLKELLSKGNNIEIVHKAIDFYLGYSPLELNDMLVFLAGRLDHVRVITQVLAFGGQAYPQKLVYGLDDREGLCCLCLSEPKDTALMPCGHMSPTTRVTPGHCSNCTISLSFQLVARSDAHARNNARCESVLGIIECKI